MRAALAPWEDLSRLSRIRTNHAKTQVWARSVHSFVSLENAGFSPSFSVEIRDVPIGLCGRSAGCDGRKCSDKCRRFGFRLAALQCSHSFKSNLAEEEHEEPVTIILDSGADAPAFPATWASAGVKAKKEHWEETTRQGNPNTWTKRCGGPFEGSTNLRGRDICLKELVTISTGILQPSLCYGKLMEAGWSLDTCSTGAAPRIRHQCAWTARTGHSRSKSGAKCCARFG